MEVIKDIGKNSIALYGFDKMGVLDMINADQNRFTRAGKRGFAFYLSNEIVQEVAERGSSNLSKMHLSELIDETFKFAVGTEIVQMINLPASVNGLAGQIASPDIADALTGGIMLWGINEAFKMGEHTVLGGLKNISSRLGINF